MREDVREEKEYEDIMFLVVFFHLWVKVSWCNSDPETAPPWWILSIESSFRSSRASFWPQRHPFSSSNPTSSPTHEHQRVAPVPYVTLRNLKWFSIMNLLSPCDLAEGEESLTLSRSGRSRSPSALAEFLWQLKMGLEGRISGRLLLEEFVMSVQACRRASPRSPCPQVIGYGRAFTVTAQKTALCDFQNALVHLANFQFSLFSSAPKPGGGKKKIISSLDVLLQMQFLLRDRQCGTCKTSVLPASEREPASVCTSDAFLDFGIGNFLLFHIYHHSFLLPAWCLQQLGSKYSLF